VILLAQNQQQIAELKAAFYRFRGAKLPPPMKKKMRPSDIMLLMSLKDLEEKCGAAVRVSALGKILHLAPSTISLMLKEVEQAGLVERYADPADKRRVYVRATQKGQEAQREVMQEHEAMLTGFAEYLGEEDTADLIRILRRAEVYVSKIKEERHTC